MGDAYRRAFQQTRDAYTFLYNKLSDKDKISLKPELNNFFKEGDK